MLLVAASANNPEKPLEATTKAPQRILCGPFLGDCRCVFPSFRNDEKGFDPPLSQSVCQPYPRYSSSNYRNVRAFDSHVYKRPIRCCTDDQGKAGDGLS